MAWFSGWFGGRHHSGEQIPDPMHRPIPPLVSVTEDTALQQSAVFACIRLIASTIGTLPLELYRQTASGREKAKEEHLYNLLKHSPNRNMDGVTFWETMGYGLGMRGNAYARKDRRGGVIRSLWPLVSQQMRVNLDAQQNKITYFYTIDGKEIEYAQSDIFHIRLFGTGIVGFSPLGYATRAIGLAQKNDDLVSSYARSGGKATGIFKVDKLLNPEQRKEVRENIIKPIEDSDGSSTVLLELGADYKPIQLDPVALQMLESRKFSVEDIARLFGVPSILINDAGNSTTWGSGVEQIILGFYKLTLNQYLRRIESAIRQQLFSPQERKILTPEFTFEGLLRADTAARADFYSKMVQNGLMSRNEVRKKENLPTVDGGDALTVQTNLAEIDQLQRIINDG